MDGGPFIKNQKINFDDNIFQVSIYCTIYYDYQ